MDTPEFEIRVGAVGEGAHDFGGLVRVHAERGRPPAHRERTARQRTVVERQVDARQHRDPAPGPPRQLAQHAQLVRALDVEALNSRFQRGRHLVRCLAGAAEGQRATRHGLGDMGEFAARGDLVAVDVRTERGEDLRLGVGLGGVVELDALGEGVPDRRGVSAEGRQVVDVGG